MSATAYAEGLARTAAEVDEVLYRLTGVFHAAVAAQPDDKWGEVPCAFVELKPDAQILSETEAIAFCRDRLAHFKCPRRVVFTELAE